MTAEQLREKYLNFFEKRGHKIIPSAPLIPSEKVELAGTQRVLFTTAGMHPLIPYLLGEDHPHGKRLTSVQKSLRTDDIDEVGDSWHNTFFEMLGNWSLGDPASPDGIGQGGYWKEEALGWSYEFITQELEISKEKLWVTVFEGDPSTSSGQVPKDEESIEIWKGLGIPEDRIIPLGRKDNWWGPVGETGPCGPDSEMFVDVTGKSHGPDCRPGDSCGRFSEIWNDVFMEYDKLPDGTYKPLKQKNVDTGLGVERTIAVLQGQDNVYATELFSHVISLIREKSIEFTDYSARVVADHLRASTFLLAEGLLPSNVDRGYVLRRLLRRAVRHLDLLKTPDLIGDIINIYINQYSNSYPELEDNKQNIAQATLAEKEKFNKVIEEGLKRTEKLFSTKTSIPGEIFSSMMSSGEKKDLFREFFRSGDTKILEKFNSGVTKEQIEKATIGGEEAFNLYQTFGFPTDTITELAQAKNLVVDIEDLKKQIEKHQDLSRTAAAGKFKGGLADYSDITIRGHTATHLLHQALRDVLGDHVRQTGSNITPERIRFDFSHPEKLTGEQIKEVEKIVNSKIKEDLSVKKELMSQEEADKKGAIGLFLDKYGDKVSIYEIGPSTHSTSSGQAGSGLKPYSVEYCGGPHVGHTGEVGEFKIIKEEALGAGQRRIRAVLE